MAKLIMLCLLLATVSLAVSSCSSEPTGSREFVPGKGWVPTK